MAGEEDRTRDGPLKAFFGTRRIITLVKDCAILAVAAYLIHFVAQVIYYRNAEYRFLNVSGEVAYAASGIAIAFLVYAIAHIVGQYREGK